MPRANPPVKHMPTAPTPGPPHCWCSWAARARNQATTGLVRRRARTENSWEMHARPSEPRVYRPVGSRPSSPNRWGITTVNPASATIRANRATLGVMPGSSLITITAGPDAGPVDGAGLPVGGEAGALEVLEPAGMSAMVPGRYPGREGVGDVRRAQGANGQGHHHRTVVRTGATDHCGVDHAHRWGDEDVVELAVRMERRPGAGGEGPPPAPEVGGDRRTPEVHVPGQHRRTGRGGEQSVQPAVLGMGAVGDVGHVGAEDGDEVPVQLDGRSR